MAPFPPGIEHLVNALYPPQRQELGLEVATIGRRLYWIGAALQLAVFGLFVYTGAAVRLRGFLAAHLRVRFLISFALVALVVIASAVLMLPFTWYDSYVILHRYDLSRESPGLWFHDWSVALLLGAAISALAGAFYYGIVRRFPKTWPIIAAIVAAPVVLVSTVILPVVIEPLFNEYKALAPSPLTKSILALAVQHGVNATAVYEFDLSKQSTASNAFVSGLGSTERIALSDNLLKTFAPDEALYVTAHELGHYVHGDLWRGAFYGWLGSLLIIAVIWLVGGILSTRTAAPALQLGDPAGAPLLLAVLLLLGVATAPIGNAISRGIEHNADVFAAENTHLGTAGVRAFARLGSQALSPLHPPALVVWYFYTHPQLDERIMFAAQQAGLAR